MIAACVRGCCDGSGVLRHWQGDEAETTSFCSCPIGDDKALDALEAAQEKAEHDAGSG
ncbi:MAG: hypothetical protein ABIQ16_12990 [Polyangiaceae bacterium]